VVSRWASSATRGAKASHWLNALTRESPPGYNRGVEYVASAKYEYGCRDLAFDYHERMGLNRFAPRMSFDSLGLYPNSFRIDWRRCPVILVDEDRLFSILGITPRFISAVQSIQETESFQKQLARLGSRYQKLWGATRGKLNRTTALSGLDFKPWHPRGKGWFSVRIEEVVPLCGTVRRLG
jgi:hypothetical protein